MIILVPHLPEWAAAFEEMRRDIIAVCGGLVLDVLHIGSTAIPGIAAKPVIDMTPLIRCYRDGDTCAPAFAGLGFEHMGEFGIAGRHYFRWGEPRTHQAHMYEVDHPEVGRHIRFRDYLRAHPVEARAYEVLKRELAARFADDIGAYADAKNAFCARIEVLAWGEDSIRAGFRA